MKTPILLASIGTLAALSGVAPQAHAHESHRDGGAQPQALDRPSENTQESASGRSAVRAPRPDNRHNRHNRGHLARRPHGEGTDRGMQAVPTTAGPGEPGHGWQYFTDSAASSAVVISPQGEYFLSRGRGLRLVALTRQGS